MGFEIYKCPSCHFTLGAETTKCGYCGAEVCFSRPRGVEPPRAPASQVRLTPSAPPPLSTVEWANQARAYMAAGDKIGAIKVVRTHTGMGLREAKDFVESGALDQADEIAKLGPSSLAPVSLPTSPVEWANQARAYMAAGDKIGAIKIVRTHTGMGLREAKDFVESGALDQADEIAKLGPSSLPPASLPTSPVEWANQARAHMAAGDKIGAIKVVRTHTGMGLREAKDFVESGALDQAD